MPPLVLIFVRRRLHFCVVAGHSHALIHTHDFERHAAHVERNGLFLAVKHAVVIGNFKLDDARALGGSCLVRELATLGLEPVEHEIGNSYLVRSRRQSAGKHLQRLVREHRAVNRVGIELRNRRAHAHVIYGYSRVHSGDRARVLIAQRLIFLQRKGRI